MTMQDFFGKDTLSVSQLTDILKELIEGAFSSVSVEGEISNCRPSSTGHLYFTLKDKKAAISAVMFKGKYQYIPFKPKDGQVVKVTGSLSVYATRGTYQIIVNTIEKAGIGDILALLEERKKRLALEGVFNTENKIPLPFFPQTIGVISSPTGAGTRDIVQIVQRRNPKISIIILPTPVQGEEAVAGILQQIKTANAFKLADVLIVGRGGGSLEDLLPFSDETIARAIAASKIPIVSAVGHEIDWAISDFAADVRAPTPSAAAELTTPLYTETLATIQNGTQILIHEIQRKTEQMKLLVKSFSIEQLELRFRSIEQPLLQRFDDAKENLGESLLTRINDYNQRIRLATNKLEGANPSAILARGYSMVRDAETLQIIRNTKDTSIGRQLEITAASAKITAKVTHLEGAK
ncbi:MAG TPA: exodeoxyribonuclease VII large subunit [Treponemataceae bacterium]|nr:exodeoxyribonuclease VII large subunit [Treponemataceae bacterium]